MSRSQIFVDTAEKSVLNLFCKLLRFKSDTSETSKDVALQTRKILQMFVIFSFHGITSLGLNFVGLRVFAKLKTHDCKKPREIYYPYRKFKSQEKKKNNI